MSAWPWRTRSPSAGECVRSACFRDVERTSLSGNAMRKNSLSCISCFALVCIMCAFKRKHALWLSLTHALTAISSVPALMGLEKPSASPPALFGTDVLRVRELVRSEGMTGRCTSLIPSCAPSCASMLMLSIHAWFVRGVLERPGMGRLAGDGAESRSVSQSDAISGSYQCAHSHAHTRV